VIEGGRILIEPPTAMTLRSCSSRHGVAIRLLDQEAS
jgi:hypothetical protein